jgi:starch synthase
MTCRTPPYGVPSEVSSSHEPSPWAKAIASHSRHAAVIGEAAYWMRHKDRGAHAYLQDVDDDGHEELILRNDRLFAVFSPSYGGRLVYLFKISGHRGQMVIGTPCDDWNGLEELNKYMGSPPNHPGALAEVRHENDRYRVVVTESCGNEARAVLVNKEEGGQVSGLEKSFRLHRDKNEIEVAYQLPRDLPYLSVECGLSPDYFHLVRFGRNSLQATGDSNLRGYSNNGVSVWVRLGDPTQTVFSETIPREFGHGYAIQFRALKSPFKVWIGTR